MNTGDYVYDKVAKTRVRIIDRIEAWGYVSYEVYDPANQKFYKASEEQLNPEGYSDAIDENYLRYVVLLAKIRNEAAAGLLSSLASGIIPLPHQIHVLKRVLEKNAIRYMLADEVGLGKTIEAGMIIKELKSRRLVSRILVVCPTGLLLQWEAEMQEKFHEKFNIIKPSDHEIIRRISGQDDVYSQYDQVISPMDSIKPLEKRAGWSKSDIEAYNRDRVEAVINGGWDLIIIDEAHRLSGSSGNVARYKLGNLLSKASPYLLLLTATPHNGKKDAFLRLISLLDEGAFPNSGSIIKDQVSPFIIRTEKREAIDNNGSLLFKKRITHPVQLCWSDINSMQRELYQKVSSYVYTTYNKALRGSNKNMCLIFLLIIMQRMVTSSTAAIRNSLERRLVILENQKTAHEYLAEQELSEQNIEDGSELALCAPSVGSKDEIKELKELLSIAEQAQSQSQDAKIDPLISIINSVIGKDRTQKIIIFTEFIATQGYLSKILVDMGYDVTTLNGSMDINERTAAIHEFKTKTSIFISTDAGGEGLNLQFANTVINYDLPWNPMRIEQRCGRVDRIGQQYDVHVYNFILSETVEARVQKVLEEKLAIIFNQLGIDKYSDILDSDAAEYDLTEIYMKSVGQKTNSIEKNFAQLELEMKQQVSNIKTYKDILHENKDLTQLVGTKPNFDIDSALRSMLSHYESWQGRSTQWIDKISIADNEIVQHLRSKILQDEKSPILSVKIENFPNEEGYFMLWQLSISDSESDVRILPIFVNKDMILRPVAGERLMEVFLRKDKKLIVKTSANIEKSYYGKLENLCKKFAEATFCKLRENHIRLNEENYQKHKRALTLRKEAVGRVGIENIKKRRLTNLLKEESTIENDYKRGKQVYPDFKLMLLAKLEV
ncbi:MAG: DEAD/DEAH box helicase [Clostridia bacterium]|nr:DEAD/DEAH box helicase [Clostridia bacterium]